MMFVNDIKVRQLLPQGLIQPLPILERTWTDISMDFIEILPKSYGKFIIMVIVDQISKYAYFFSLAHPYKVVNVVQLFLDNIFKLYGMPTIINSDCGSIFTRKFQQKCFKTQGIQLNMSSSYHPQTYGQIETVTKCLEIYLYYFALEKRVHWVVIRLDVGWLTPQNQLDRMIMRMMGGKPMWFLKNTSMKGEYLMQLLYLF